MGPADIQDGGYSCRSAYAGAGTATAGGTGDNTAVEGSWIDRAVSGVGIARSAKLVIAYTTTLTTAKNLTFAAKLQDATDSSGTGAADVAATHLNAFSLAATVVATATGTGTIELDLPLETARQFIRAVITPNLSATADDTVAWTATMILFGHDRLPISKTLI